MLLTREAILSAVDLRTERVQVPEWGGEIILANMSGAARDAWEQSLVGGDNGMNTSNIRARLVAACAVDESGARLFSPEDADALGQKSAAALDRCVKVAQRLNRITEDQLEEVTKN